MKLKNGWIFSAKEDALVFVLPILVGSIFLYFFSENYIANQFPESTGIALVTLYILVDIPHFLSTVFRTYLDPIELQKHKKLFVYSPPLLFLSVVIASQLFPKNFWHMIAYFSIYHFIRQFFGWVMWSSRNGGETKPNQRRENQVLVYTLTFFPIVWVLSHPVNAFWMYPGDFPLLFPTWVGDVGHVFYWIVVSLYLLKQGCQWKQGMGVNWAKQLIIFTNALVWYVPMVLLVQRGMYLIGATLQLLSHGIPYILLSYKYGKSRWGGESKFPANLFIGSGILVSYVLFLLVAGLEIWGETFGRDESGFPQIIRSVFLGLVFTPQLVHFFLDGFVWKPSLDPRLKQLLVWSV